MASVKFNSSWFFHYRIRFNFWPPHPFYLARLNSEVPSLKGARSTRHKNKSFEHFRIPSPVSASSPGSCWSHFWELPRLLFSVKFQLKVIRIALCFVFWLLISAWVPQIQNTPWFADIRNVDYLMTMTKWIFNNLDWRYTDPQLNGWNRFESLMH